MKVTAAATSGREVTIVYREASASRRTWEPPAFEEVGVSAEASAYMGVWEFGFDWD